jgi:putative addiction module component (TIGR02574 family)
MVVAVDRGATYNTGMSSPKRILEEALALPPEERAQIADALEDSLIPAVDELSPEWRTEVAHRIAQIERGDVSTVPWSEVKAEIRRRLGHG